jgi:prepilin-type N-terminal cleavage/methylation domain-containing protein
VNTARQSPGRKRPGATGEGSSASAGFTLIEILVAMLVFLTGVAGLYALLSTGLSMQQDGLQIARSGRRMEAVVQRLQQDLSAGRLRADVVAAPLADGSWYRATFLPVPGDGTASLVPLEIRVAASRKALDDALPVTRLLSNGPTMAQAVRAWRAKRLSDTRAASPSTLESR